MAGVVQSSHNDFLPYSLAHFPALNGCCVKELCGSGRGLVFVNASINAAKPLTVPPSYPPSQCQQHPTAVMLGRNNWAWTVAQCPVPCAGKDSKPIFPAVKTFSYGSGGAGFHLDVYTMCNILRLAPRVLSRAIATAWCRSNSYEDAEYVRRAALSLSQDVSLYCDLLDDCANREDLVLGDFLEAFGTHERSVSYSYGDRSGAPVTAAAFFAALHLRGVDLHCIVPAVAGVCTGKAHSPRFNCNMSMICPYRLIVTNDYLHALLPYIEPEHTYDLLWGTKAEQRLEEFMTVPVSSLIADFLSVAAVEA